MYKVVYYKKAVKYIEKLKCAKLDKKAKLLVDLIKQNPFENPPPVDSLRRCSLSYLKRAVTLRKFM